MTITSRRKINFKHVGTKISDRVFSQEIKKPSKPIGIKTPLSLGVGQSGLFDMHFQPADQIHDNLKNLIKTNRGERLGRFEYGADLNTLAFDYEFVGDFENEVTLNIRNAVDRFMPVVEISNVEVAGVDKIDNSTIPSGIAKVIIDVTYNVPKLKVVDKKLRAIIYAGG
jgi:phage baseplate assembly protein W